MLYGLLLREFRGQGRRRSHLPNVRLRYLRGMLLIWIIHEWLGGRGFNPAEGLHRSILLSCRMSGS